MERIKTEQTPSFETLKPGARKALDVLGRLVQLGGLAVLGADALYPHILSPDFPWLGLQIFTTLFFVGELMKEKKAKERISASRTPLEGGRLAGLANFIGTGTGLIGLGLLAIFFKLPLELLKTSLKQAGIIGDKTKA